MPVTIFGAAFTSVLLTGCDRLSALGHPVLPEWILAMAALESAGTWDPHILEGHAQIVPPNGPDDMRPEIEGTNGLRLSWGTGCVGLFMRSPKVTKREGQPDLMALYAVRDPVVQLQDAISYFATWSHALNAGGFKSRSALYACNLAPARLAGGNYDDETILYSADPADKALGHETYWPAAYRENARAFGLNPNNPTGKLRMGDLARGLDNAIARSRARYEVELAAARAMRPAVSA